MDLKRRPFYIRVLMYMFSKNFKSGKKSALVFSTLLFLLFCPIMLHAQEYTAGVAVNDTIVDFREYAADFANDFRTFGLDSSLIPYVTGLSFQAEITATNGIIISDSTDTVKVGDIFFLPASNQSGFLKLTFEEFGDSFDLGITLTGTPEAAGEAYYCELATSMTLSVGHNHISIFPETDSLCTVKSFPSSVDYDPQFPIEYDLKQNYPNPFNAGTMISYQLPASGKVTLTVYNLLGERVRLLLNEQQEAGAYSMHWDGKDQAGKFVTSGVYLYRIKSGRYSAVRKAVFVK